MRENKDLHLWKQKIQGYLVDLIHYLSSRGEVIEK